MTNLLSDLYRHMEWADATVWAAVMNCERALADSKIRDTLYHIHMVQRAFVRVWRNEPRQSFPTFEETPAVMDWARSYYPEAFAHLQTLSNETLSKPMPVPWASMVERLLGHAPEITTVGDTVLQAALHSLYHRGQVNARLRELGGEPPLVDYIAWIWMGRPAADWTAVAR